MWDIIVIGSGITGMSAALFAARRGLKVLAISKDLGGQAVQTDEIANYPGLDPVSGYELVYRIKRQAEAAGAGWQAGVAEKLRPAAGAFVVTASGRQYKARAVILALGKTPLDLDASGEKELLGRGVSYCANCDLPLCKKKSVAVVGEGDLALDAALLAGKFAKQVYLIAEKRPTGHPALMSALAKKKKIQVLAPCRVSEVLGRGRLTGLMCLNLSDQRRFKLPIEVVFVEKGFVVQSEFLRGVVDLDEAGQVRVGLGQETSVPGIFAAGDATNRPYKQAVISAGDGALAGLAAYDYLARQEGLEGLTSDWTQVKRVK